MQLSSRKKKFLILFAIVSCLGYVVCLFSFEQDEIFSIGLYGLETNNKTLKLYSYPGVTNPIITVNNISDRKAKFVADPFLVLERNKFFIFFEVCDVKNNRDIALASSTDGVNWKYEKIILDELFGLSYPLVFKSGVNFYMIPESAQAKSVRLYVAEKFPYNWKFLSTIIPNQSLRDSTIFNYENTWWMFTSSSNFNLRLFYSDDLNGQWVEHPSSPLINNDSTSARCGGNVLLLGNKVFRVAQDDSKSYGGAIRVFEVLRLSRSEYKDRELKCSPLVAPVIQGWNNKGMHQLGVCKLNNDKIIVTVDGKGIKNSIKFGKFLTKTRRVFYRLVKHS
jgi:hypothetical protein